MENGELRMMSGSLGRSFFILSLILVGPAVLARDLGTIMPTGDSITDGDYSVDDLGYRNDLADLLVQENIDFTYVGDTLGTAGDPDYPGHFLGGAIIQDFLPTGYGHGWGTGRFDIGPALSIYQPDILLIHLGTNNMTIPNTDVGPYSFDEGMSFEPTVAGFMAELLVYIRTRYSGLPTEIPTIVLSLIIPQYGYDDRVQEFNGYLAELAHDMAFGIVTGEPIHVVLCDHYTPFIENDLLFTGEPGDYMFNDAHPNDLGYSVMAQTYLRSLLDETSPATTTDLTVWGVSAHTVKLYWTASGDDILSGDAAGVILKLAKSSIDTDNQFEAAWNLLPVFGTGSGGTLEQIVAGGLPRGRRYWVALRTSDDAGNSSGISNSPTFLTELSDSLIESFDDATLSGGWFFGDNYYMESGVLKLANPIPGWKAPAMFSGESKPWDVGITLQGGAPQNELDRVGLILCADDAEGTGEAYALIYNGSTAELHIYDSGVIGGAVDSRESLHGALTGGERFGAIPFIFRGSLLIRTLRNGEPDVILDTGESGISLPEPRYNGVVLQGALGWGVEEFRIGGPGLWESPEAFVLLSPDSGATVEDPPVLVWQPAMDPDPWDMISYTVIWSDNEDFLPLSYEIDAGSDTSVLFPPSLFEGGERYFWFVRAEDRTGFTVDSGIWWFDASTNHTPSDFVLLEPAQGESVYTRSPTLAWSSSYDPDPDDELSYTVTVSREPELSHPFMTISGVTDTTYQIEPLTGIGPWYWSVSVTDLSGAAAYADTSFFYLHSTGTMDEPVAKTLIHPPWPNPSTGTIHLTFSLPEDGEAMLRLYDMNGRLISATSRGVASGSNGISYVMPSSIPGGVYLLRIEIGTARRNHIVLLTR